MLYLRREALLRELETLAPRAVSDSDYDESAKRRWLTDALSQLRLAVSAWGRIDVDGGRVRLSLTRSDPEGYKEDVAEITELACRRDDGSWETFVGEGTAKEIRFLDEVLGDELHHHFGDVIRRAGSREAAQEKAGRAWDRLHWYTILLLAALATGIVGCGVWLVPKVVRWIRGLSKIEHIRPAPPLNLGGGMVIEGAKRPSGTPHLLPSTPGSACDTTLIWQGTRGDVIVANSTEHVQFLRVSPDSDIVWHWVVTIDGIPHKYDTSADAIHISGVGGMKLGFSAMFSDSLNRKLQYTIDEKRRLQVGKEPAPTVPAEFTDGRMSIGQDVGPDVRLKWGEQVVLGRQRWRPPLIRYTCDEALTCTFTLAPGPWQPCWQRVEVQYGDSTVTDTRETSDETLTPVKGPLLSGDWDAVMLRAQHRFVRSGTYPFAFGIKKADSKGFSGPCIPGPPNWQADRLRWYESSIEIRPRASGSRPLDTETDPVPDAGGL